MNLLGIIGYPLFFVAASEVALGVVLLRKNPRKSPVNKTVAALSLFLAIWCTFVGVTFVRASMGLDYDLFYRACWIGWLAVPAALQLAFYLKDERSRNARIVGFVLYPLWLIIIALCLATDLVEEGPHSLFPFISRRGPLGIPARILGALLLIWLTYEIIKVRRHAISIKRGQLNYFLAGTILLSVSAALSEGVLQFCNGLSFCPKIDSYASLPWAALTYYSIGRYRLFDIKIAFSRTMTVLLLLTGAIGVHIGLFKLLEPATGPVPALLISLAFIGLILLKTPLKKSLAVLLENMILRDKYEYQKILRESIRAVSTISNLNELLNYIVTIINKSLNAGEICLFLKGKDGHYHAHCSSGIDKQKASAFKPADGIINWLMLTRQIFIREEQELLRSPEDFSAIYQDMGAVNAELVIPLFCKGELLGILTFGHKGNSGVYVQSDIDLLESLADQAAVAIENIRLSEEAITDGLTGLYVHRYFKARLQEEVERARRYRHPLSLLLIDVDHFKKINDHYGHLAGDRILRELSKLWRDKIRLGDVLARYGGEEFAVILPETSELEALRAAENLRVQTEGVEVDGLRVTISVGVGFFDGSEREFDCDRLIGRADRALYHAKRTGRNRVAPV